MTSQTTPQRTTLPFLTSLEKPRHHPCLDLNCTVHHNGARVAAGMPLFTLPIPCREGLPRRDGPKWRNQRCHLCSEGVESIKRDQWHKRRRVQYERDLMIDSIEKMLSDMSSRKHASCSSPSCDEHSVPDKFCASGLPSQISTTCHLCISGQLAPRDHVIADIGVMSLIYPSTLTIGDCCHPGRCKSTSIAGRMLHHGNSVDFFWVYHEIMARGASDLCSICFEVTGKIDCVMRWKFAEGWENLATCVCQTCYGSQSLFTGIGQESELIDISGGVKIKIDSVSDLKGYLIGSVDGSEMYDAVGKFEGIPVSGMVTCEDGKMCLGGSEVPEVCYLMWPSSTGTISSNNISLSRSALIRSDVNYIGINVVVDSNCWGRIATRHAVDCKNNLVMPTTVFHETLRVRDEDAIQAMFTHMRCSKLICVETPETKDLSILQTCLLYGARLVTLDQDMALKAEDSGINTYSGKYGYDAPNQMLSGWRDEFGLSTVRQVNSEWFAIFEPKDKDEMSYFRCMNLPKIVNEQVVTLLTLPLKSEIPKMSKVSNLSQRLNYSDDISRGKVMVFASEEPGQEDVNFILSGQNKLKPTVDELNLLQMRIADSLNENSTVPLGYKSIDVDSIYPLWDLIPAKKCRGISHLMEGRSLGLEVPDFGSPGTKQLSWDPTDIDIVDFYPFKKDIIHLRARTCGQESPIKAQLLAGYNARYEEKKLDIPCLERASRLMYHVLSTIKGKVTLTDHNERTSIVSHLRKDNDSCYVSDFGLGNMGAVIYRIPNRFDEEGLFVFRLFFRTQITTKDGYVGFRPHKIDILDGIETSFTRIIYMKAGKLAHMANFYHNTFGLRKLIEDPARFALIWFSNFFSGSRWRIDSALGKFAGTIFRSDLSQASNLFKKYLAGPRRRPIDRLNLLLWYETVIRTIETRNAGMNSKRYESYYGTHTNLIDYVDACNTHTLAYNHGETHGHLMNMALKDLKANSDTIPNQSSIDWKIDPTKSRLVHGPSYWLAAKAYFSEDNERLNRNFIENPITMNELHNKLETSRNDFLEGPTSGYWHAPFISYNNSVCSMLVTEQLRQTGVPDTCLDAIGYGVKHVKEWGYSLAFQAIKPQSDAAARPIVAQTICSKLVNWPHQAVGRIICESDNCEMVSKSASTQVLACQSLARGVSTIYHNEDMASWSPSDKKVKFKLMVWIMFHLGVLTEQVAALLLQTLELSDNLRICVPARYCKKTGVKRVWERESLSCLPLDGDSFDVNDPSHVPGFSRRKHLSEIKAKRSRDNGVLIEEFEKLSQKEALNYYAVITMKNGWMQGLFHFFSSLSHSWQMKYEQVMMSKLLPQAGMTYMVHSDDKNTTRQFRKALTAAEVDVSEKLAHRCPRLFSTAQSETKASITLEESAEESGMAVSPKDAFSEFLGHYNSNGRVYSSTSRFWKVMNSAASDDLTQNNLGIVSSLVSLINNGEDVCYLEAVLSRCQEVLNRRFGGFTQGFRLNDVNILAFGGRHQVSLVEIRALGSQADVLWKLQLNLRRTATQLTTLPRFKHANKLKPRIKKIMFQMRDAFKEGDERINGLFRSSWRNDGKSAYNQARLSLLGHGIGKLRAAWEIDGVSYNFKEKQDWVEHNVVDDVRHISSIKSRFIPLSDDLTRETALRSQNFETRVIFSQPLKEFYGAGTQRIRVLDLSTPFAAALESIKAGVINPYFINSQDKMLDEIRAFKNAYSLMYVEQFEEYEDVWESHAQQNRNNNIVSSQFTGLWDFPHCGVYINLYKGQITAERMIYLRSAPVLRIQETLGYTYSFVSRCQNEINRAACNILKRSENLNARINKSALHVDITKDILEIATQYPSLHSLTNVRMPLSTSLIIKSILGSTIDVTTTHLQFRSESSEGVERFEHVIRDTVVNYVDINWTTKIYHMTSNLDATHRMILDRYAGEDLVYDFTHDQEINTLPIGQIYGGMRSRLRFDWDLNQVVVGTKTRPLEVNISLVENVGIPMWYDITPLFGSLNRVGAHGYQVHPNFKSRVCKEHHLPRYPDTLEEIKTLANRSLIPSCSGTHGWVQHHFVCSGNEQRFCAETCQILDVVKFVETDEIRAWGNLEDLTGFKNMSEAKKKDLLRIQDALTKTVPSSKPEMALSTVWQLCGGDSLASVEALVEALAPNFSGGTVIYADGAIRIDARLEDEGYIRELPTISQGGWIQIRKPRNWLSESETNLLDYLRHDEHRLLEKLDLGTRYLELSAAERLLYSQMLTRETAKLKETANLTRKNLGSGDWETPTEANGFIVVGQSCREELSRLSRTEKMRFLRTSIGEFYEPQYEVMSELNISTPDVKPEIGNLGFEMNNETLNIIYQFARLTPYNRFCNRLTELYDFFSGPEQHNLINRSTLVEWSDYMETLISTWMRDRLPYTFALTLTSTAFPEELSYRVRKRVFLFERTEMVTRNVDHLCSRRGLIAKAIKIAQRATRLGETTETLDLVGLKGTGYLSMFAGNRKATWPFYDERSRSWFVWSCDEHLNTVRCGNTSQISYITGMDTDVFGNLNLLKGDSQEGMEKLLSSVSNAVSQDDILNMPDSLSINLADYKPPIGFQGIEKKLEYNVSIPSMYSKLIMMSNLESDLKKRLLQNEGVNAKSDRRPKVHGTVTATGYKTTKGSFNSGHDVCFLNYRGERKMARMLMALTNYPDTKGVDHDLLTANFTVRLIIRGREPSSDSRKLFEDYDPGATVRAMECFDPILRAKIYAYWAAIDA